MKGKTQRSFTVNFDNNGTPDNVDVKITTYPSTHQRHPNGFYVVINGWKQHIRILDRQEAQDKAYVNWVNKHCKTYQKKEVA